MQYIQANWPAPQQVKAFTTTRLGWGERKAHEINRGAFNLADPSYVAESRALEQLFELPGQPLWVTQVHGTNVIEATPENIQQNADATFTKLKNRVSVILTADCLPVFMCNQQGTQVAVVHAGWRGLSGGIIENALQTFQQPPEELLIWLGPAIGPEKFEVGRDVYDAFTQKHAESAIAFQPHTQEKWLANLYELAKIHLNLLGVTEIYGGGFCTYSQEDLFFSYRRDKGKTGRMASVIWLASQS